MRNVVNDEKDLVRIAPKPPEAYEGISLALLTAYSLYWLHQWELRRTIEAVSILNWRLFPTKFAMVGFPQFPDAFRTNRSLLQGQPKYRNFLTGAAAKGFSLNERGIGIARELIRKLGPPMTSEGEVQSLSDNDRVRRQPSGPARSVEPEREMSRVRTSKLFEKWKAGVLGERDLIHVHALLGIFDHTPVKIRRKLMKDLERFAEDTKDEEITRFLIEVRQAFPQTFVE